MIGLIYADHLDPSLSDDFHRFVCEEFAQLERNHTDYITALVDPYVTTDNLWATLNRCTFIFYWGHGGQTSRRCAAILGSQAVEGVRVEQIGAALSGKQLYLDACGLAKNLSDADFEGVLLIAPTRAVSY